MRVEPVSVDEAYLEFIIPLPVPVPLPLPLPESQALDPQLNQQQQHLTPASPLDDSNSYPHEFGLAKASELRQKIFTETGCTAR
jgi:nucleotidyltransferase/DNA polymerase involved in DNA repair